MPPERAMTPPPSPPPPFPLHHHGAAPRSPPAPRLPRARPGPPPVPRRSWRLLRPGARHPALLAPQTGEVCVCVLRAFLYSGFLSHGECDHLVKLAKGKLQKSMVADNDSGKSVMSQVRTSSGTFLAKHEDEIVSGIERRVAAWTFLPEENAESIQVLHYEVGQKYDAHFDYFQDKNNQKRGGHRVATVLMYLTDVKKGGETVFPNVEGRHLQHKDETWSDCARSGLAVKPRKGDALLFFSLHVNATTDPSSLHGSCPVVEGEKWSATKWIHVRSFDDPPNVRTDAACSDDNELCPRWAAVGECYRNPKYMVGTKDSLGFCRRSCGVCDA